jgi:putative DNA-invertase from lambdoid prophage Rac
MSHVMYLRCSTLEQSIESQRHALVSRSDAPKFDKEFRDEGVSGAVLASSRQGFAALLGYVREGDTVHVYAVDRLGRDAIDVQTTVRTLLDRGVAVYVHGLGLIAQGVGELILAVLAQVADMERHRIRERTTAGRTRALEGLRERGRTHHGKTSMGRPVGRSKVGTVDPWDVVLWRKAQRASIAETAAHWKVSEATVKRYCAAAAHAITATT